MVQSSKTCKIDPTPPPPKQTVAAWELFPLQNASVRFFGQISFRCDAGGRSCLEFGDALNADCFFRSTKRWSPKRRLA